MQQGFGFQTYYSPAGGFGASVNQPGTPGDNYYWQGGRQGVNWQAQYQGPNYPWYQPSRNDYQVTASWSNQNNNNNNNAVDGSKYGSSGYGSLDTGATGVQELPSANNNNWGASASNNNNWGASASNNNNWGASSSYGWGAGYGGGYGGYGRYGFGGYRGYRPNYGWGNQGYGNNGYWGYGWNNNQWAGNSNNNKPELVEDNKIDGEEIKEEVKEEVAKTIVANNWNNGYNGWTSGIPNWRRSYTQVPGQTNCFSRCQPRCGLGLPPPLPPPPQRPLGPGPQPPQPQPAAPPVYGCRPSCRNTCNIRPTCGRWGQAQWVGTTMVCGRPGWGNQQQWGGVGGQWGQSAIVRDVQDAAQDQEAGGEQADQGGSDEP